MSETTDALCLVSTKISHLTLILVTYRCRFPALYVDRGGGSYSTVIPRKNAPTSGFVQKALHRSGEKEKKVRFSLGLRTRPFSKNGRLTSMRLTKTVRQVVPPSDTLRRLGYLP